MSLENNIQELENEYKVLQSNIAVTDENWRDVVKEKFFKENLNDLPNEYTCFTSALQSLNDSFAVAENAINSLK